VETPANERAQLEQAIIALEAQRNILGDAAVDVAVAALHQKIGIFSITWGNLFAIVNPT